MLVNLDANVRLFSWSEADEHGLKHRATVVEYRDKTYITGAGESDTVQLWYDSEYEEYYLFTLNSRHGYAALDLVDSDYYDYSDPSNKLYMTMDMNQLNSEFFDLSYHEQVDKLLTEFWLIWS